MDKIKENALKAKEILALEPDLFEAANQFQIWVSKTAESVNHDIDQKEASIEKQIKELILTKDEQISQMELLLSNSETEFTKK